MVSTEYLVMRCAGAHYLGPWFFQIFIVTCNKYIKENKHLPGVSSELEIKEKGINIAEIQKQQMEKIEELSLYIIDLQKQINDLKRN